MTSQPFPSACLLLLYASQTPLRAVRTVHKRSHSRGGWALLAGVAHVVALGSRSVWGTAHVTPQPMAGPLSGAVSRGLPEGAGFQEKNTNLVHEGLG